MPDVLVRLTPAQRESLLELVTYGLAALADRKIKPRAVDLDAVRKLREAEEER